MPHSAVDAQISAAAVAWQARRGRRPSATSRRGSKAALRPRQAWRMPWYVCIAYLGALSACRNPATKHPVHTKPRITPRLSCNSSRAELLSLRRLAGPPVIVMTGFIHGKPHNACYPSHAWAFMTWYPCAQRSAQRPR